MGIIGPGISCSMTSGMRVRLATFRIRLGRLPLNWIVLPGINGDTLHWVRVTTVQRLHRQTAAIVSPSVLQHDDSPQSPVINPASSAISISL